MEKIKTKQNNQHVSGYHLMLSTLLLVFWNSPWNTSPCICLQCACIHVCMCMHSSLRVSLHAPILCHGAYALSTLLAHTRAPPGYKSCLLPFLMFCSGCCSLRTLGELFLSPQQQKKCSLQPIADCLSCWGASLVYQADTAFIISDKTLKSPRYIFLSALQTHHVAVCWAVCIS